ncbi:MAG: NifU family protein [Oligoflexia bacterium]|nr:NifU family protein [Oligoflexia bacterium]
MDLLTQAKEFIDREVRPMIQGDGGDIEVVELTPENVLKVRLQGSCVNCASASMTLAFGVEERIKEYLPEITGVEQVS